MKKVINFRMTPNRAAEIGHPVRSGFGLAMRPVEIDTGTMSIAAAWIADHITATYVIDEYRDKIGIVAISRDSMRSLDEARGIPAEEIVRLASGWGDAYTSHIRIQVTFPIYGKSHKRPEDVIEQTAMELLVNGCSHMIASNGDKFEF